MSIVTWLDLNEKISSETLLTISTVGMMIQEIPVRPRKKGKKATLRNLEIDQEKTCEN